MKSPRGDQLLGEEAHPQCETESRVSYRTLSWGGGGGGGKQDGSRMIVVCETHACLLGGSGGSGGMPILNLYTSQIASDPI